MKRLIVLPLSLLILVSCSQAEISSFSSESSAKSQDSSSVSVSSQVESSASSASSASHPDTPGQGAWELLASALPSKNPDSGTFHDIDFSVLNGKGETISFHADYIRRGEGTKGDNKISAANTIQLSKNDVDAGTKGYIYMTSGYASHIEFKTLRIYSAYNQADYSGVPAIYSADEMDKDNGEQVEVHRETSEDGNYYIYSADIPYSRFRIETSTGNAMYICYLSNLA